MRLSEIGNKEIVDLSTGASHGQLWDAEMNFDRKSGKIKSVLVPSLQSTGFFKKGLGDMYELPWSCLLYTSPSPRDYAASSMPSSA